jgi:hypothetical protein
MLNMVTGQPVVPRIYSPFAVPVRKKPGSRLWEPQVSSRHNERAIAINAEAEALALALPVTAGGAIEYGSMTDFGAILMCDDPFVNEGFDVRQPFLAWLKRNSKALLDDFLDLQKYGACIATWTYSASEVHINAWEGSHHTVTLGFHVGATGVGSVGPEISWARGRASNGWAHFVRLATNGWCFSRGSR